MFCANKNSSLWYSQAPWMVICRVLITVLDDERPLNGWNRPLFCITVLTSPLFILFAIKSNT